MKMELPIYIPDEIPTEETTVSCMFRNLLLMNKSSFHKKAFVFQNRTQKPLSEKWLKCWKHKALCAVDAQKPSIYYLHYQPARI